MTNIILKNNAISKKLPIKADGIKKGKQDTTESESNSTLQLQT
jgi:hypothetical protein